MLKFSRPGLTEEFERCDWRLVELVEYATRWLSRERDCDLLVTSVERERAETRRLYEQAGLTPPRASVHDVRPCRGADAVPFEFEGDNLEVGDDLSEHLATRWIYPRGHKVCIWHSVAGAHWHFQVPWDELKLRATTD